MSGGLVFLTGAGDGIGRAAALAFAAEGDRVVVTDVDGAAAEQTAALVAEQGGVAHAYRLDVTDVAEWEAVVAHVCRVHGVPDVLVNNAGLGMFGTFDAHSPDDWRQLLDVNLMGVVHGCRTVSGRMIDRGQGGQIVTVSSAAAFVPTGVSSAYSTSKAAVRMLGDCLRIELARHRIGVSTVCPGYVGTGFVSRMSQPGVTGADAERRRRAAGRAAGLAATRPERVARAIVFAARHNKAVVPVRSAARAGYWMSRVSPGMLRGLARATTGDRLLGRVAKVAGR